MKILVTGSDGFIGSNLVRMLLDDTNNEVIGFDAHTYAANPSWRQEYTSQINDQYQFKDYRGDLRIPTNIESCIEVFKPDVVFHLAAESHVCKSIEGPRAFAETNFMGTFNLLEALRKNKFKGRLVHVSTDETFGSLDYHDLPFNEDTSIKPRSPYAASKAASDLMVRAYVDTYGIDAVVTRCTNNFGPNQHEEKLIPKTIYALLRGESVIVHGNGLHMRDWIFVDDHCKGLIQAMRDGKKGEIYCLGSGCELTNKAVIGFVFESLQRYLMDGVSLRMKYTDDRPTDDKRYAVDTTKACEHFGFRSNRSHGYFKYQLDKTVQWYMERLK